MSQIISDWFGDDHSLPRSDNASVAQAEARLGCNLSAAFIELHEMFGWRADVWNVQDTLLTPSELYVESQHLIVARENQDVFRWAISLASIEEPDPPVLIYAPDASNHLSIAAPSVSEFAARWLLLNAKFSARTLCRANGPLDDSVLDAVVASIPRLPIPDIAWHVAPIQLYGDARVIVEVDAFTWIWVTAQEHAAFDRVVEIAVASGMAWESVECPG